MKKNTTGSSKNLAKPEKLNLFEVVFLSVSILGLGLAPAYAEDYLGTGFSNNAKVSQSPNQQKVRQLIVKLKPTDDKSATNLRSNAMPTMRSSSTVTRLQAVIDGVQQKRSAKNNLLFKRSAVDVSEKIRPKKAIFNNTVVLSLGEAVSRADAEQLMKDIAADSSVEYVEVDEVMRHLREPNDTEYTKRNRLT